MSDKDNADNSRKVKVVKTALKVIYVKGRSEVFTELIDRLRARDGKVFVVSSLAKCKALIEELKKAKVDSKGLAIIYDGSSSGSETDERVAEISVEKSLFEIPSILIGVDTEERAAVLKRDHRYLIAADYGVKATRILENLDRLLHAFSSETKGPAKAQERKEPSGPKTYGGQSLIKNRGLHDFDDDSFLPSHPKMIELADALEELTDTSEALGVRVRRVGSVVKDLAEALGVGDERARNMQIASMFLNWGFRNSARGDKPLDAINLNILNASEQDLEEYFTFSLEEAMEYALHKLDDDRASRTLSAVQSLVRKSKLTEKAEIVQDAQLAFLAEITDRSAWRRGIWSPVGSYQVGRFLRYKRPFLIDQPISEVGMRMLAEASLGQKTLGTAFIPNAVRRRNNSPSREAALKDAKLIFGNEVKLIEVEIFKLKPGMLVGRPVLTGDGAVVLGADIRLTKDMIARLLQLSLIRPLQMLVNIVDESESEAALEQVKEG